MQVRTMKVRIIYDNLVKGKLKEESCQKKCGRRAAWSESHITDMVSLIVNNHGKAPDVRYVRGRVANI